MTSLLQQLIGNKTLKSLRVQNDISPHKVPCTFKKLCKILLMNLPVTSSQNGKGQEIFQIWAAPCPAVFCCAALKQMEKGQELPRGVSHHAEHLHVKNGSSCSFWAQSKENWGALTCTCSESRLMELLGEPEAEKGQVWEWHLPMPGWNKEGEVKISQ